MSTVMLSESTYDLLRQRAQQVSQPPDQVADELLRQQLAPQHAYIEVARRAGGARAVIKGTRILVSTIVGYLREGETAESLVSNILPHLTLAQVYDAMSYYHDHQTEIERELSENTEANARAYLRERLDEEGYQHVTGESS